MHSIDAYNDNYIHVVAGITSQSGKYIQVITYIVIFVQQ